VSLRAVVASALLIATVLGVKMLAKFVGVWTLTLAFRFGRREAMYTALLMSTGLTFRTISALYGLSHQLISEEQYAIHVTAVILSAIVPTVIAERWFDPGVEPPEGELGTGPANVLARAEEPEGKAPVGLT